MYLPKLELEPKPEKISQFKKRANKNVPQDFLKLTTIAPTYSSKTKKEFKKLAKLFSLSYEEIALEKTKILVLSERDVPLIAYLPSSWLVLTTFNYCDLKFLEVALRKYPKVFTPDGIVAHLVRAIYSLSPIEKN